MDVRVLIAGGGTGGHLFPGIALAEQVRADGGDVLFVGTARGLEARVLPEEGWELELVDVSGIKGRGLLGLLVGTARLPRSYFQSRRILKRFRPEVVVGVGGYASGPIVATAAMMGIPTAILAQDSIPGITNRILGKLVQKVFCAFEDRGHFSANKTVLIGNPIRQALLERLRGGREARATDSARLFVFGGSQGARALNEMFMQVLPSLCERVPTLELWHQTGAADEDRVREAYAEHGLSEPRIRVAPFIRDMTEPYRWCDLVVCRSGATSIAELAVVGCPAVLIPFPHATDNHQEHNATGLVSSGAAVMIRQSELEPGPFTDTLAELLGDRARLRAMSEAMLGAARPTAAADIVAALRDLVE